MRKIVPINEIIEIKEAIETLNLLLQTSPPKDHIKIKEQIEIFKVLKNSKTTEKLEKIILQAQDYIYGGNGYNSKKFNSKKWQQIRNRFEEETKKMGGVDYNLGDCLA